MVNKEPPGVSNKWKILTAIGSVVAVALISVLAYNLFFRQSQSGSTLKNASSDNSRAASQASSWWSDGASLSIDAALVFQSGDVKPVARTEFTLLDRDLEAILKESNYTSELPEKIRSALERPAADIKGNRAKTFSLLLKSSIDDESGNPEAVANLQLAVGKALAAVKPHVLYSATSDFQGNAKFENLKPGKYYLFGYSKLGNSAAVWNIETVIKDGENKLTLDNGNAQSTS